MIYYLLVSTDEVPNFGMKKLEGKSRYGEF